MRKFTHPKKTAIIYIYMYSVAIGRRTEEPSESLWKPFRLAFLGLAYTFLALKAE